MSPASTLLLRRTTAALAVIWALSALVLSVGGQLSASPMPRPRSGPPGWGAS